MSNIKLEPFRSLNDFLMEEFQLPNFADLERWNGRVEKNLIYYQTNYFLLFIIVFGLVGLLHPGQMLLGSTAVIGMLYLYRYLAKNQTVVHSAQKKHPFLCLGVVFGAGYLVINLVGSVLVFVFGIVLPLAVIFAHASLRTRSAKNKLVNQMDKLGVKKTPMGLILDEFGMALENIKDCLAGREVSEQEQQRRREVWLSKRDYQAVKELTKIEKDDPLHEKIDKTVDKVLLKAAQFLNKVEK